MNKIHWNFPSNNFTLDVGVSESGLDTFKKDPPAGLARETVQNSIDARWKKSKPVRVEMHRFDISRDEIPSIDDLQAQTENAINTWKKTESDQLDMLYGMLDSEKSLTMHCCRISDFNTTGLLGVGTDLEHESCPWHDLIFGSGMSNKSSTSGGSKGVGKNALFANSEFGTVFYSTLTKDHHTGHIGMAKICSANVVGGEKGEKTTDVGYYSADRFNTSLKGQFSLDKSFERKESGTDVFIVGFVDNANWISDVVSNLLDSFMYAIMFGNLELSVDGCEIKKETVKDYIFDATYIDPESDAGMNAIRQYLVLTQCKKPEKIKVEGYGEALLYFLDCGTEEYRNFKFDKNECVMVRYPDMKIKEEPIRIGLPFAALCYIGNNDFNKALRRFENTEHTEWQFKRIPKLREEGIKLGKTYNTLLDDITDLIGRKLLPNDNGFIDVAGAADFMPRVSDNDLNTKSPTAGGQKELKAKASIANKDVVTKNYNPDANIEDDEGNGLTLDFGAKETFEDQNALSPEGTNGSSGGPIKPSDNIGQTPKEGDDKPFLKREQLRGTEYRFVCVDKREGLMAVIFDSDFDYDDVHLSLAEVDENCTSEPVQIFSARKDNVDLRIEHNEITNLSIKKGEREIVYLYTDRYELFGAEVDAYACRK